MADKNFKSGFAVIVGRSNAGKSTLLNALVGTKVAITTEKPQTTRHAIHGIFHDERGQIVFVDTPGILFKRSDRLTKLLNRKVKESLEGVDVVIYLADPTRAMGTEETSLIKLVKNAEGIKIMAVNKIDLHNPKYLEDYRAMAGDFDEYIELSALRQKHLKGLVNLIFEYLPKGEPAYPEFQFTNLKNEFWFAEIIREKIFNQMWQEAPYNINVEVDELDTREDGTLYIHAIIEIGSPRYKKMIIGAGGRKIKEIGTSARKDLEKITGGKVYLETEVRVNPRWMEKI